MGCGRQGRYLPVGTGQVPTRVDFLEYCAVNLMLPRMLGSEVSCTAGVLLYSDPVCSGSEQPMSAHSQYEPLVPSQCEDDQYATEATHLVSFRVDHQVTPSAGGCDDPSKYDRKERSGRPTRVKGGHPRDQEAAASRSLAASRSPQ